jgi:hypothetical protein
VTPVKLIENACPPNKMPERMVIVKRDPSNETEPVRNGFPRGEKNTGVPSLQLKAPGRLTTILPLTGTGLAGVIVKVIAMPVPPLAGFDSVKVGDIDPSESVRTSQTSIWFDVVPVKPSPKYRRPRKGRTADTRNDRVVVSVLTVHAPVDAVNMSTSLEYWPAKLDEAYFSPPAKTAMP